MGPQVQRDKPPDSLVLARPPELRPDGPRQAPPVRHRLQQGPAAGLWCAGGYERGPEVPDPQGRQVHRPAARGPHLLQPARPPGLRDVRQAAELPTEGDPRVLRRIRLRLRAEAPVKLRPMVEASRPVIGDRTRCCGRYSGFVTQPVSPDSSTSFFANLRMY